MFRSYQAIGFPDFVEYTKLVDDIESIFTTKDLEKAPLLEPEVFQPPEPETVKMLDPENEAILQRSMRRLAEQVCSQLTFFYYFFMYQCTVQFPVISEVHFDCMNYYFQVRKNRIQLFPLFEDYDRVNNGTVSRSQFRRVLNELDLACLVPTEQEWICLWEKFDVKVGGKDDVNYIAFCDMIYDLAGFEWRKP